MISRKEGTEYRAENVYARERQRAVRYFSFHRLTRTVARVDHLACDAAGSRSSKKRRFRFHIIAPALVTESQRGTVHTKGKRQRGLPTHR